MTNSHNTSTPALSVESEEAVAAALWQEEAREGTPKSIWQARTLEAFRDTADSTQERWRRFARAALAAAPAPNPSPAAKGGEAVRPLKAIGEEAERYRASRGPEWCKIFDTLRDYRMSNMAWEDGEPGYPLVDLMSRVGDTVTIADGEWEMVLLADEIGIVLAESAPAWEAVEPAGGTTPQAQEIINALDFYDRVVASSDEERIAVGTDHWTRLLAAVRAFAARSASREGASDE